MFVFQLAAIAALVALLPLTWIWVKGSRDKYRQLIWLTTFLTVDLIMFGGFTRLTDSGLGCPDWPGCYGESNPLHAHAAISAAERAMPHGPVTVTKAWIEMLHRYFAMAIGVLIIALVVLAWRHRKQLKQSPWLATALLGLVCLQGAFGAWTVTLKLQPVIVTTHLLLGMALLGMLTALGAHYDDVRVPQSKAGGLRYVAGFGLCFLVVQIALGGWVSTNYAVLACSDFPQCNGAWIPVMDFQQGFTLWRELGKTTTGDGISLQALIAIHWTHRMFAVVVLGFLAYLVHQLRQHHELASLGGILAALLGLQLITGISNIVLQWPLLAALAHNGGAALLLLVLTRINVRLWAAAPALAATLK